MAQEQDSAAVRREVLRLRAAISAEVGAAPFSKAFSKQLAKLVQEPEKLADVLVKRGKIKAEERPLVLSLLRSEEPEEAVVTIGEIANNHENFSPLLVAVATAVVGDEPEDVDTQAIVTSPWFWGAVALTAIAGIAVSSAIIGYGVSSGAVDAALRQAEKEPQKYADATPVDEEQSDEESKGEKVKEETNGGGEDPEEGEGGEEN